MTAMPPSLGRFVRSATRISAKHQKAQKDAGEDRQ